VTEADVLDALRYRHRPPAWAFLEKVRNGTGYQRDARTADAIAMSVWPSRGLTLHGFEVKVVRGDWLRELRDPEKADEFFKYCVGVDTKILTQELRWVPAGNLAVGDKLIGFDENSTARGIARRWLPGIVENIRIEKRPVWKIYMESGGSLLCTPEHRWLCAVAPIGHWDPVFWCTTERIAQRLKRKNCRVYLPQYVQPWTERRDYGTGLLGAAFAGEGCLVAPRHTWRLEFAQKQNDFLVAVQGMLSENGFSYSLYPDINNTQLGVCKLLIDGGLPEIFRFLGQIRPPRLITVFQKHFSAYQHGMRTKVRDRIVAVEQAGDADVAVMSTSTRTFIAEGYGSHNCDHWWVVTQPGIVEGGELPATWGHMVIKGSRLTATVPAPKLTPIPADRLLLASILREALGQVTPEAQLERARREGRKDGIEQEKKSSKWDAQEAARDLERLKKTVAEFEKASGVSIVNEWNAGPIGDAVRLVVNDEHVRLRERLRDFRDTIQGAMTDMLRQADDALAVEKPEPKATASSSTLR